MLEGAILLNRRFAVYQGVIALYQEPPYFMSGSDNVSSPGINVTSSYPEHHSSYLWAPKLSLIFCADLESSPKARLPLRPANLSIRGRSRLYPHPQVHPLILWGLFHKRLIIQQFQEDHGGQKASATMDGQTCKAYTNSSALIHMRPSGIKKEKRKKETRVSRHIDKWVREHERVHAGLPDKLHVSRKSREYPDTSKNDTPQPLGAPIQE